MTQLSFSALYLEKVDEKHPALQLCARSVWIYVSNTEYEYHQTPNSSIRQTSHSRQISRVVLRKINIGSRLRAGTPTRERPVTYRVTTEPPSRIGSQTTPPQTGALSIYSVRQSRKSPLTNSALAAAVFKFSHRLLAPGSGSPHTRAHERPVLVGCHSSVAQQRQRARGAG